MIKKIQYDSQTERETIIQAHSDLILIEEQNIKEGNFLIFSSSKPLVTQVDELKSDNLVTFEVLATIYEELLASKGSV